MMMQDFLKEAKSNVDAKEWYYFDYKYMHEWLKDQPEILASFDWRRFGFDKWGDDSTLWIGNKGAHTNCHQDSYGCNLVAQMHGRKQWLLFPPNSGNMLQPTRVPYEESTNARLVVLEPGEVLFVPMGWWHYVESMDLSVSVNVWLPLATDCEARLREALVKLIVTRIGKGIPTAADEPRCTFHRSIKLIQTCLQECRNKEETIEPPSEKKARQITWSVQTLIKEYSNYVSLIPELERSELKQLLVDKRERFPENDDGSLQKHIAERLNTEMSDLPFHQILEAVINAFCHQDVINEVANILAETTKQMQ